MNEDGGVQSDADLAGRVRWAGDEEAFRRLYRRYSPGLYLFLLRMLGGKRADAEDVLQETWIRAVARLDRVDTSSSLQPWLRAIALNVLREGARVHQRRLRLLDEHGFEAADGVDSASWGLRIDLDRAIAQLPEGCRRVLVLHDVEGLTHEQIAKRLDIAAGTSKSQLAAARTRLRQAMSRGERTGDRDVMG